MRAIGLFLAERVGACCLCCKRVWVARERVAVVSRRLRAAPLVCCAILVSVGKTKLVRPLGVDSEKAKERKQWPPVSLRRTCD